MPTTLKNTQQTICTHSVCIKSELSLPPKALFLPLFNNLCFSFAGQSTILVLNQQHQSSEWLNQE